MIWIGFLKGIQGSSTWVIQVISRTMMNLMGAWEMVSGLEDEWKSGERMDGGRGAS